MICNQYLNGWNVILFCFKGMLTPEVVASVTLLVGVISFSFMKERKLTSDSHMIRF